MAIIPARGTWGQNLKLFLLNSLLGLLVFWLLGLLLQNISTLPGPQQLDFTQPLAVSPPQKNLEKINCQISTLQRKISSAQQTHAYLKAALENTQNTIHQILDIQRLQTQKNSAKSIDTNQAFQQNTRLFLTQQHQLQQINQTLIQLNTALLPLQENQKNLTNTLNLSYLKANQHYQKALNVHQTKIGLWQVSFLLIFFLVTTFIMSRKTLALYRSMYYAITFATLLKIAAALYAYFPHDYFRYILIFVLISVVIKVLKNLLQKQAFPTKNFLLKQYREAYIHFFCPICAYPIRRGPLRYMLWTRRSLLKVPPSREQQTEESPYHCPQCGNALHEHCQQCQKIRHSLLPYCEYCGSEQKG